MSFGGKFLMSFKVENLEKNMAKLTIEVSAEEFDKACEKAYQKNKNKIHVQGFRKGKAPRNIIEKMYGAGVFFEDAANELIPDAYAEAAAESGLDIVSRPEIDVVQIGKGQEFIFTAEVAVKPEVELGQYKGVEVEKLSVEVTEEEVDAELNRVREQNARMITVDDRAVENGDIATIDYEGFCDGVAFEGGKGENHPLTIGSHSFIDTFEEQLIGKNIGDEVDVNVTFPEQYHAPELAGKPALFKVKINEIKVKELPQLDHDFAQDVSEFDTLDEYKNDVKATILSRKEKEAKNVKEEAVIEKIIESAKMDIPEPMIEYTVRQVAEEFSQRIQAQGLSLEQYFKFTGMNANTFMENLKPQAIKRIESRLVLEAVVKAENIVASEEEVEKELEQMAQTYNMELDKLKELMGEEEKKSMAEDVAVQKALEFVVAEAVEVEKQ